MSVKVEQDIKNIYEIMYEILERLKRLEEKRGPGRPPKGKERVNEAD